MAYISTAEVKEKRNKLKKLFPSSLGWKLSVRCENYTKIAVNVLEAPVDLRLGFNDYMYIRTTDIRYPNESNLTSIGREVFSKIYEVINEGNFDKSDPMTDYFHIGFFTSMELGDWGKPFKINKDVVATEKKLEGTA